MSSTAASTPADKRTRSVRRPGPTPKPRLSRPLVRVDGELRPATWDQALDRVATGFAEIRDRHGSDAFAVFSCSKSTNEMNYAVQRFARTVLGTNNIDSCNRT